MAAQPAAPHPGWPQLALRRSGGVGGSPDAPAIRDQAQRVGTVQETGSPMDSSRYLFTDLKDESVASGHRASS
jgi:hypothetical protein